MSCWHVRMRVTAASRARRQVDEREDRAGWVRAARSEAQLGRQARPLARRGPRRAPDAGLRGVPACRRGVPCRLYLYSTGDAFTTTLKLEYLRLRVKLLLDACSALYVIPIIMNTRTIWYNTRHIVNPRAGTEDAQRIWCWRGVLCLLLWKIMKWRRILRLRY